MASSTAPSSSAAPPAAASTPQDLATLRKVKALVSAGKHPEYTAIIKPHALKAVTVSAAEAQEQLDRAMKVKPKVIKASKPHPPTSLFRDDKSSPAAGALAVLGSSKDDENPQLADKEIVDVDSEGPTPSLVVENVAPSTESAPAAPSSNKRDISTSFGVSSSEDRLAEKRIKLSDAPVDKSPLPTAFPSPATPPLDPSAIKMQELAGSTELLAEATPPPSTELLVSEPIVTTSSSAPVSSTDSRLSPALQPTTQQDAPTLLEDEPTVSAIPAPSLASRIFTVPNEVVTPSDLDIDLPQPFTEAPSKRSPSLVARASRPKAADSWEEVSTSVAQGYGSSASLSPVKSSFSALDHNADEKPTADSLEASRRAFDRDRDEAERAKLALERKSMERAKYLEREKEKEAYRARLRAERERETQAEVTKYKLEREMARNGGANRDRGYDHFGRPKPEADRPSLPPADWNPRPAIDARFPPRAQPHPSDPHYVPPQHYQPTPAVYERAIPDGRPSSLLQDPRDYPPDPYYNRLAPPPPPPPQQSAPFRRPYSPPPPQQGRGYGDRPLSPPRRGGYTDVGPGRGRSPPPPRRAAPYVNNVAPGPAPSRPFYDDNRGPRPDWDRAPGNRAPGPPDSYGYDRDRLPLPPVGRRSPPPSSYGGRRGPSPPFDDAADILRRAEKLKEEAARLEKEAAIKKLMASGGGGPPGGYGRAGGGDRGRDSYSGGGGYRDAPPAQRPYSPPPPPVQNAPRYSNGYNNPPPAQQHSYAYRLAHGMLPGANNGGNNNNNNNNDRGRGGPPPPPPPPPQQYAPVYEPRFDGPPPGQRRAGPPYGGGPGGGGQQRRDGGAPVYERDQRGAGGGYNGGGGPGGAGGNQQQRRGDERDGWRR